MNMLTVVKYYLGEYAERIPPAVLDGLASKLDNNHIPYCTFWAYLVNHWEKSKLIFKNFLQSDKVWQMFLEHRRKQEDIMKVLVGIELERFMVESRIYGVEVLSSEKVRLMPVIRYAAGASMGLPKSMYESYEQKARQQLREEPLLFDLLEKLKDGFPITKEEVMHNG